MGHRNGALDILRSLAIILVVTCHVSNAFEPGGPVARIFGTGGRGVDLFFILSGWLLGRQLLEERERTGTIQVRRFWLRRAFRIFPAYFAVLGLTFLQALVQRGWGALEPAYLIFIQNYFHKLPYFAVSWSLCVEEHFYLVIGPILLLMRRFRGVGGLVVLALLIPTVCRLMGWYYHEAMFETHVRYDQCAIGVGLAWIQIMRPALWSRLTRFAPLFSLMGLGLFLHLVFVGGIPVPPAYYPTVDITAWTLLFAAWVLQANASPWWAQALQFRLTRYLADRAFSIYLLHVEAISAVRYLGDWPLPVRMALAWGITLIAAEVLYRVVERPGMRLRDLFAITRSEKAQSPRG